MPTVKWNGSSLLSEKQFHVCRKLSKSERIIKKTYQSINVVYIARVLAISAISRRIREKKQLDDSTTY